MDTVTRVEGVDRVKGGGRGVHPTLSKLGRKYHHQLKVKTSEKVNISVYEYSLVYVYDLKGFDNLSVQRDSKRHRVDRVLGFLFSRPNWDSPTS
jgi:hypothetical protein